MASLRKRGKSWYYRYVDADGIKRERKGCSDRRETERMAHAAEAEAAQVRAGYLDPKATAYRDHEARPIADHLAEWRADQLARGVTVKQANQNHTRAARVVELAGVRRLSDLSPSRVQAALGAIRAEGKALRTVHHVTRSIKGFSRWLWKDGRTREDALAHIQPPKNPESDRRHRRRALSPGEAARLIRAAESGPVIFKTSGPDRAMLYRLALGTGFRAAELASLTPESFRLDDDPPSVIVAAGYSKRRRDDLQPIRPDLATVLRPWLADKPPGTPLFTMTSYHTAEMIRRDLEAAGVPYETDSGVADFHALRHSYVSALARSGAPVKVIQSLARHSTPTLTLGTYTHISVLDETTALAALPPCDDGPEPTNSVEPMAATGTDVQSISECLAHHLPTTGDGPGRPMSSIDDLGPIETGPDAPLTMGRNSEDSQGFVAQSRPLSPAVVTEGEGFEPPEGVTPQRFSRPPSESRKLNREANLRIAAPTLAPHLPTGADLPPDLAEVAAAWPELPEAVRAGILAMVRAAMSGAGERRNPGTPG